jgi:hypothetical protein
MKVYYHETIFQKLDKVIEDANSKNLKIRQIILNNEEFNEYKYLRGFGLHEKYKGILIFLE